MINRDGGLPEAVSEVEKSQGAPTWSPDGKSLVYADVDCHPADTCKIYRVSLVDRSVDEIPNSTGFRTARWSPNGHYVAALKPDTHGLWLFNLTAQQWTRLADDANGDDISWSPDSAQIFYSRSTATGRSVARLSLRDKRVETAIDFGEFNDSTGGFTSWFCLAPDGSIIALRQIETSEIYAVEWAER